MILLILINSIDLLLCSPVLNSNALFYMKIAANQQPVTKWSILLYITLVVCKRLSLFNQLPSISVIFSYKQITKKRISRSHFMFIFLFFIFVSSKLLNFFSFYFHESLIIFRLSFYSSLLRKSQVDLNSLSVKI